MNSGPVSKNAKKTAEMDIARRVESSEIRTYRKIDGTRSRTRTRTNTNPNDTEANNAGRCVRACDARKAKSKIGRA